MIIFNGNVVLPDDTPMTYQQLILAAIAARTYSATGAVNTREKAAATSRFTATPVAELSCWPRGDIYIMDAFKGVRNGAVIAGQLLEADFTLSPGGGQIIVATQGKDYASGFHANGVDIGSRVVYQHSGADVVIDLDVCIR